MKQGRGETIRTNRRWRMVAQTSWLLDSIRLAPAGRLAQLAQVKPPLPQADALGAPHGIAPPAPVPPATLLAKVENCLETWLAPHAGQVTPVPSAPTRWSTSKRRPHSRQVYS
jgi:hypothetical protein